MWIIWNFPTRFSSTCSSVILCVDRWPWVNHFKDRLFIGHRPILFLSVCHIQFYFQRTIVGFIAHIEPYSRVPGWSFHLSNWKLLVNTLAVIWLSVPVFGTTLDIFNFVHLEIIWLSIFSSMRKATFSSFTFALTSPAELPREDRCYSSDSAICSIFVVCKEYHTSEGIAYTHADKMPAFRVT